MWLCIQDALQLDLLVRLISRPNAVRIPYRLSLRRYHNLEQNLREAMDSSISYIQYCSISKVPDRPKSIQLNTNSSGPSEHKDVRPQKRKFPATFSQPIRIPLSLFERDIKTPPESRCFSFRWVRIDTEFLLMWDHCPLISSGIRDHFWFESRASRAGDSHGFLSLFHVGNIVVF